MHTKKLARQSCTYFKDNHTDIQLNLSQAPPCTTSHAPGRLAHKALLFLWKMYKRSDQQDSSAIPSTPASSKTNRHFLTCLDTLHADHGSMQQPKMPTAAGADAMCLQEQQAAQPTKGNYHTSCRPANT